LLLSAAAGIAICLYPEKSTVLLVLPIVLFIRMALNAIDGMMARELDMKTNLGAFLNELGDVASDTMLYLPLALVYGFRPDLVVLVVLLAALTEMTGVLAQALGGERRYEGPMGKSDRAFVFGALGLTLGLGVSPAHWLTPLMVVVLILLVATVLNRAIRGLRELS
jgi:CDP-diacylglycerol--glycerol-3-phosphate 3-phosphatidyltransferase